MRLGVGGWLILSISMAAAACDDGENGRDTRIVLFATPRTVGAGGELATVVVESVSGSSRPSCARLDVVLGAVAPQRCESDGAAAGCAFGASAVALLARNSPRRAYFRYRSGAGEGNEPVVAELLDSAECSDGAASVVATAFMNLQIGTSEAAAAAGPDSGTSPVADAGVLSDSGSGDSP